VALGKDDPHPGSATSRCAVTLAYLKGKHAEYEEAQEHANSSSLALYAKTQDVTAGDFWLQQDLPFFFFSR
jgi:hypothetical protein